MSAVAGRFVNALDSDPFRKTRAVFENRNYSALSSQSLIIEYFLDLFYFDK